MMSIFETQSILVSGELGRSSRERSISRCEGASGTGDGFDVGSRLHGGFHQQRVAQYNTLRSRGPRGSGIHHSTVPHQRRPMHTTYSCHEIGAHHEHAVHAARLYERSECLQDLGPRAAAAAHCFFTNYPCSLFHSIPSDS